MDQADFAEGGSRDVFESFSCLSSLFAAAAAVDFFCRLLRGAAANEICFFSTCTLSLFPISFEMDGEQERGSPSVRSEHPKDPLLRSFFALLKFENNRR